MRPIITFLMMKTKIPIRKNEIRKWLTKSGVEFPSSMLRKQFHIDKYLESMGHVCLRLPLYHPQLNPIELVWAEIKQLVALKNTTFNIKDIEIFTRAAISSIDKAF